MKFLQILLWVTLAILIVIFSANNWSPITISIWEGLLVDTKLPVLVVGSFLIGFLPLYFWYRITKWLLKRKISAFNNLNSTPQAYINSKSKNESIAHQVSPLESKINLTKEKLESD